MRQDIGRAVHRHHGAAINGPSGTPKANPLVQDNRGITISEGSYVLVVDDDDATRYALPQLIRHHRPMLLVETAGSVDETMQLLAERNFLTIVSDVRMPQEDGIRLIRRMREKGYRIPVIVMTAT